MKKGFFVSLIIMFSVITFGIGMALGQDEADLIVSDLIVQNEAGAGFKIFITDVTRNIGTGAASPSITKYYIKAKGFPGKKVLLGRRLVPELAKKTANIGSNYVALPTKDFLINKRGWPVPGTYYIIAVADALKYIDESKEKNNKRRTDIEILDPTMPPPPLP